MFDDEGGVLVAHAWTLPGADRTVVVREQSSDHPVYVTRHDVLAPATYLVLELDLGRLDIGVADGGVALATGSVEAIERSTGLRSTPVPVAAGAASIEPTRVRWCRTRC